MIYYPGRKFSKARTQELRPVYPREQIFFQRMVVLSNVEISVKLLTGEKLKHIVALQDMGPDDARPQE
jgi:hypothetical protein